MQRYFVDPQQIVDHYVTLTGDSARHIALVMRAKNGDRIICCDGSGREYTAELRDIGDKQVRAEILEARQSLSEPKHRIWIAQSLPKGDKFETVIQKGTEIGAVRFLPFISERTIVQYDAKKEAKRLERWRKIAIEAAEQAHRGVVPDVDSPLQWRRLMELAAEADLAFFCYEKETEQSFKEALKQALTGSTPDGKALTFLLIIGPEGGFTEAEREQAERHGCVSVSLGKTILRTETAALVGLSYILYETE